MNPGVQKLSEKNFVIFINIEIGLPFVYPYFFQKTYWTLVLQKVVSTGLWTRILAKLVKLELIMNSIAKFQNYK